MSVIENLSSDEQYEQMMSEELLEEYLEGNWDEE
jgi:hypothetical protein